MPRPRDILELWRAQPALTRWLFLFAVIHVVVINAALRLGPWTPLSASGLKLATYHDVAAAVTFHPRIRRNEDSWTAMFRAWEHTRENPDAPLYTDLMREGVRFIYPPSSLVVCEAVGRLVADPGRRFEVLNAVSWVMLWVNAGVVGLILVRSAREHLPGELDRSRLATPLLFALGAGLTLNFYPVAKAVTLGQAQAWINAGVSACILLWMRGRDGMAGALAGLPCLFKPHYGLVLAWAALRGHRRFAAAMAVTAAVIGGVGLLAYGWGSHVDYLASMSDVARRGDGFHKNQSVNGLLNRLVGNGSNVEWSPMLPPYIPWVYAATLVSSIALLTAAFLPLRLPACREPRVRLYDLLLVVLVCTMAAPLAWEHHYGVLAPIFAVLLPALVRRPVLGRWTLPVLAAAFVLSGHHLRFTLHFAGTLLSPLQSYVLLAALAVVLLLWRLRRAEAEAAAEPA